MKRKVLKTLLCMSITTTMLFGETAAILADTVDTTATEQQELESAEVSAKGAKIVSSYVLADVTGVAYDAATGILSWNKVAGASEYSVTVYDAAGNSKYSTTTSNVYVDLDDYSFAKGQAYTIKITAKNMNELCLVAADVTYEQRETIGYDEYDSKEIATATGTETRYALYKHPVSANPAVLSAVVRPDNTTGVTALAGISVKEVTTNAVVFKVTPNTLQKGEVIEYTYANNPEYRASETEGLSAYSDEVYSGDDIYAYLSNFEPGETIYVKAKVYNSSYAYQNVSGQTVQNCYSAEVSATYKVPAVDMDDVNVVVDNSSIVLRPYASATVTGYQYQRKNGKKWENLAQQGDNYTDAGLKADTKYTYRVRGYIYNEHTKKTTYTSWKTVSATTWGASLKLKADAASAKAVKLTWEKVPGAQGYEVYRVDTDSATKSIKNGESNEWFDNATLIKTIKNAKTARYTDKKLTKGEDYTYIVRAFRTVGKTKCYIQESTSVSLTGANGIGEYQQFYNGKGQLTVKWAKMTDISGYKVEKRDERTGDYVAYKTLKKGASSITLPSVAAGAENVKYRIRPYKGDKVYAGMEVEVYPQLAAVKGVKAVQTTEGVQVTWSPVAGADYYRVYRAKKDALVYNENTKTYQLPDSVETVNNVNYTDTSAGVSLALTEAPKTETGYTSGAPYNYTSYKYADNVEDAVAGDGCFYDEISAYSEREITGTSVVDKTVTVKSLVRKSEDANYNQAADAEYYRDSDGDYIGANRFASYQKNADGSLKIKDVIKNHGPELGTEYYYFVEAYARPANGAGSNSTETKSIGVSKGAKVVYTKVAEAKSTKVASAKSKKKATVTIKIQKASGAKGYAVYRASKKKGKYVKVGTTTGKTYTDKNVTAGKTYYYKIASYKQSENGTFIYSKQSAPKKVKAKR